MSQPNDFPCPTCREPLDAEKHKPHLLPCLHTQCLSCVRLSRQDNGKFRCSVDGKLSSVPRGHLMVNYHALSLVQANVGSQNIHMCQLCDEPHPATHRCCDCGEDMCNALAKGHTRSIATKEHEVVPLAKLSASVRADPQSRLCKEHQEQFRQFDEDCGMLVCSTCTGTDHQSHKCIPISQRAETARTCLEALQADIQTVVSKIDHVEPQVRNVGQAEIEQAEKQLDDMFEEAKRKLIDRRDELLRDVKKIEATLGEQENALRTLKSCLTLASEQTQHFLSDSPTDTALVMKLMEMEPVINTLNNLPPHLLFPPRACAVPKQQQQMWQMVQDFGHVGATQVFAGNTTASEEGIRVTVAGEQSTFTVETRDAMGEPTDLIGGVALVGRIEPVSADNLTQDEEVVVLFERVELGLYRGTYTVKDIPKQVVDHYQLSISVCDALQEQPIQGSPFRVEASVVVEIYLRRDSSNFVSCDYKVPFGSSLKISDIYPWGTGYPSERYRSVSHNGVIICSGGCNPVFSPATTNRNEGKQTNPQDKIRRKKTSRSILLFHDDEPRKPLIRVEPNGFTRHRLPLLKSKKVKK